MPIVEVSVQDLKRLARRELSRSDLLNALELMKGEVEEVGDERLVFEASHDRPDLFSAEGLGRALRYVLNVEKPYIQVAGRAPFELLLDRPPSYRPYAYLAVVRGVELDDESIKQLFQLQEKLHLTYGGDRALVSIGMYDLDRVSPPITYGCVREGRYAPLGYDEVMTFTDVLKRTEKGVKYAHLVRRGEYPVLMDSEGQILSFPPILNAEANKVTEDTRNVLIDVTGTEPHLMMRVLNVVTYSVLERGYGKAAVYRVLIKGPGMPYRESPNTEWRVMRLSLHEIESVLGVGLEAGEAADALTLMGHVVGFRNEELEVRVPPYRIDVHGRVDLIEDVAVAYGYWRIPCEAMPPTHFSSRDPLERFVNVVRDLMVGLGFDEVVNFMLTDPLIIESSVEAPYVRVANPKMVTYSALRNSMIPSLLLTARVNSEKLPHAEVFEVGDYVRLEQGKEGKLIPITEKGLGFMLMGDQYTLTDALVTVKSLMMSLGLTYGFKAVKSKPFIEGRAASVTANDVEVGVVGEVHPSVLVKVGIDKPVVLGEIRLSRLLEAMVNHSLRRRSS